MNSAHPESLDLRSTLTPHGSLPLPSSPVGNGSTAAWDTPALVRRLWWARVCIRRALNAVPRTLVHRRSWERLFAAPGWPAHRRAAGGQMSAQTGHFRHGLHSDGPRNPFTPKRAGCLRTFDAPLVDAAIAASAGVSVGMAKEMMDVAHYRLLLEHLGSRRRLVRNR